MKREVARQREEISTKRAEAAAANDQLYRADCETRELKARLAEMGEAPRHWENTCDDLAKELKYVQGELTQKEIVF